MAGTLDSITEYTAPLNIAPGALQWLTALLYVPRGLGKPMKYRPRASASSQRQRGFILTTELVLLTSIITVGIIVGLATMRDSVVAELGDVAAAIDGMNSSYAFDGVLMYDTRALEQGSSFEASYTYAAARASFRPIPADGHEGTARLSTSPVRYPNEPGADSGTTNPGAGGNTTTDSQVDVEVISGTNTDIVVVDGTVDGTIDGPVPGGNTGTVPLPGVDVSVGTGATPEPVGDITNDPVTGCKGKGNCDNGNRPGSEPLVSVDATVDTSLPTTGGSGADATVGGGAAAEPVTGCKGKGNCDNSNRPGSEPLVSVDATVDTSLPTTGGSGADATLGGGAAAEPVTGCKGLGKCEKSVKL